jgi:hypothetical protein
VAGIAVQIAAQLGGAAVRETFGAVGAHTLAVSAGDGDQVARTDIVTGAAVVQIRSQINAGGCPRAVGQTTFAVSALLRRRHLLWPGSDQGGGAKEPYGLPAGRTGRQSACEPIQPMIVHGAPQFTRGRKLT